MDFYGSIIGDFMELDPFGSMSVDISDWLFCTLSSQGGSSGRTYDIRSRLLRQSRKSVSVRKVWHRDCFAKNIQFYHVITCQNHVFFWCSIFHSMKRKAVVHTVQNSQVRSPKMSNSIRNSLKKFGVGWWSGKPMLGISLFLELFFSIANLT